MQLYIQKWGRRVGFDLNVQPSDEALTHAIIQVQLLWDACFYSVWPNTPVDATPSQLLYMVHRMQLLGPQTRYLQHLPADTAYTPPAWLLDCTSLLEKPSFESPT